MTRDEYLQKANEGFIKDTLKKGWEKIKSLFNIGMRKIKGIIAIFSSEGQVLPVLAPQAVIDRLSESDAVKVLSSPAMNESIVEAGGNVSSNELSIDNSNEIYNYGPDGKDFLTWQKEGKFKDTVEYKNLMSMMSAIKEHYENHPEDAEELDESWEGIVKARVHYNDTGSDSAGSLRGVPSIDESEFEDLTDRLIKDWCIRGGAVTKRDDGKIRKPLRNVLILGAPGIGKSTIPNMIIEKYNENTNGDPSKMISIISINCANIDEGDFMMPTMPKEIDVLAAIKKFADSFPNESDYIDSLSPDQKDQIAFTINQSGQFKSSDAPKSWLPSYRETGDEKIDALLDANANGGVYRNADGKTRKVGGGGIIIFDEFLRCKPGVFGQLMNFLLDRKLNGWTLGSKWAIIACSNRPCDDDEVAERWAEWNPAARDRYAKFFQLIPNPEGWKKWARSKGCDELLLEFIFDKESMSGNEYPRWHSAVKNGAGDSQQVKPVTPRGWEIAFSEIEYFEVENDLSDISEMKLTEIEKCLKGVFTDDFVAEITGWLEDRMDRIDLEGIMKNPKSVYLPKKFVNDPDKAVVLIENLKREFITKFKSNPGDCSDDELANVFIWLGINYPGDMFNVQSFLEAIVKDVFKNRTGNKGDEHDGEYCIPKYIKTLQVIEAAYPPREIETDVKEAEEADEYAWPEGSMDTIKDIMREFFPWRLDGDRIKYYDALDLGNDEVKDEE